MISLGLSSIPWPAPAAAKAGPDLNEYGATGTSLFGGWLSDTGEYNPEMMGTAAFATYEKMRRSDAQVAATLLAMKLPIRAAEWTVQPPREATPIETEAADFVRECLFEEIDWDTTLSNALLMLDFGCAAHEDVYYVDGNRVRLRKLAPRLPITFQRWLTAEGSQDLAAIEQYGELPGGGWGTATLPMNKTALFTNEEEGANWAGRSVLRAAYQHWYIKSNLYKIDAIAQERNGMGIPWIELPQNPAKEDKAEAHKMVSQICAHERAGAVTPNGAKFSLVGVTGTVRDAKESIAHHNVMISMAGLAMFLQLGQSQSGNRALGESQTDFFAMSLEATTKRIARVLRLNTVARLVAYNFGPDVRPPVVAPSQVLAVGLSTIVDALQKLATAGFVTADPEVEKYLRGKMGLPEPPAVASKPDKTARDEAAGAQAGTSGDGAGEDIPPEQKPPQKGEGGEKVGGGQQLSETAGQDVAGLNLKREPRGPECFLALREIVGELDRGRDEVAAALRAARSRIQAEVVNRLVNTPVRNLHRVSIPPDERLIGEVEAILQRVCAFGADQVAAERDRQRKGAAPGDAAQIRLAEGRGKKRDPLGVYADGAVSELQNAITSRAANVALDWMRRPGSMTKGEIIRQVEDELDGQSDKWIDSVASKPVNEAFADGRAEGYEEHKDEIRSVIYSALLDINTCGNCAAADGAEGPTPDSIPDVPNPDCDGGDRCRCVYVYVFADEVR